MTPFLTGPTGRPMTVAGVEFLTRSPRQAPAAARPSILTPPVEDEAPCAPPPVWGQSVPALCASAADALASHQGRDNGDARSFPPGVPT